MNEYITRRQHDVINSLLRGNDTKEIGLDLNISPKVVKSHMSRLYKIFKITDGCKRVKLAVLLYKRQLCQNSETIQ